MPASIWPVAILLPMVISASSDVPQARCRVMPGVSGDRPDDSVASRPRLKSDGCLITAPIATSPSCCPWRPNFSPSAPSVRTDTPRLPTSDTASFWRPQGMRTPPRTATGAPLTQLLPVEAKFLYQRAGRAHRQAEVADVGIGGVLATEGNADAAEDGDGAAMQHRDYLVAGLPSWRAIME